MITVKAAIAISDRASHWGEEIPLRAMVSRCKRALRTSRICPISASDNGSRWVPPAASLEMRVYQGYQRAVGTIIKIVVGICPLLHCRPILVQHMARVAHHLGADLFSQLGGIARRERNDILDCIGLSLNGGTRLHLIVPNTGGREPDQHCNMRLKTVMRMPLSNRIRVGGTLKTRNAIHTPTAMTNTTKAPHARQAKNICGSGRSSTKFNSGMGNQRHGAREQAVTRVRQRRDEENCPFH